MQNMRRTTRTKFYFNELLHAAGIRDAFKDPGKSGQYQGYRLAALILNS